jgi:hypothetical protein
MKRPTAPPKVEAQVARLRGADAERARLAKELEAVRAALAAERAQRAAQVALLLSPVLTGRAASPPPY